MRIIAVGAHPDDVEFGCFGTLSYYFSMGNEIFIVLLSSGELSEKVEIRERESKKSADLINAEINFFRFPDANIEVNNKTIDIFRNYINKIKPDILFVHHPYDRHQDHRTTNEICLSSTDYFDKVLFYEGPGTFDFIPNVYVTIDGHFDKKVEGLNTFESQTKKPYLSIESLKGLARYRAYQCGRYGHLVEAFYCYKWVVNE
jgi:LmbE family N-acetylglucosaminyl deacetylase